MAFNFPLTRHLVFGALFLAGTPVWLGAAQETLIPARFNQAMDRRGNRWDVTANGEVADGTNDCFDGGARLQINGNSFNPSLRMMTADGAELVLTDKSKPVVVTRRIRLDQANGVMRYLEIFENAGNAPQQVQASIHSNLGGQAMQVLDLKDKLFTGVLGKDDAGFMTIGQGSRPGVFFWVCAAKSKLKPTVSINSNSQIDVRFPVDVPARGSVAILHYVAQRVNGSAESGRELVAAYTKHGRLSDPGLPAGLAKIIVNFPVGAAATEDSEDRPVPLLAPLTELAESLEMVRGKLDAVLIDVGSKLSGTVSGADFEIETAFGKTPVVFAQVAGIAGGAGVQRPIRVFLRDGEILNGSVKSAKIAMGTETGLKLELNLEEIFLLTMRVGSGDGVAPPAAGVLVTTQAGDRLALPTDGAAPLSAATPWGIVEVPLAEVRSLSAVREPFPSQRLELSDRSRILVMLQGSQWSAPSLRFGGLKIVPQSIREIQSLAAITAPAASDEADGDDKLTAPRCELLGDNRISGFIDLPELHLATETSATPVETRQILQLEIEAESGGERTASIKLIGGQELKGRLTETLLPIRAKDRVWRVPAVHLLAVRQPPPEPPQPPKPDEAKSEVPAHPAPNTP